jgi:single-strand DNA-binding protein
MIQLQIIGRVGSDCQVRESNGQFANSFSVAHSHHYTDKNGQKVESTTWVKCTIWTKKNSIGNHIKKGMVVSCQGFPKANWWKNQANEVQVNIELNVDKVEFILGVPKKDGEATDQAQPQQNSSQNNEPFSGSEPGIDAPPF